MTSAEVARLKKKYETSYQKALDFIKKKPNEYQKHPTQEFQDKIREYERQKKQLTKQWKSDLSTYLRAEHQLRVDNRIKKGATVAKKTRTRKKGRVSVKAHTRRYPK